MKVALVHDHLAQDGGAERVLKAFSELYPEAPIYVMVYDEDRANDFFRQREVRTSFIQKIPLGIRRYQAFLPLMPTAVEKYNLSEYDLVLSSTSMFAKGVITRPETLHIDYCHTPTRFLWTDSHSYVEELRYSTLIKKFIPPLLTYLRLWDRLAAERVDRFIANSKVVQKRIQKYYGQKSEVIYPPVDTRKFRIEPKVDDYYLAGGRLVAYKRFDIVVHAFNRLGIKLKIYGDGPQLKSLQKIAKPNITFLGRIRDKDMVECYSKAIAFINPQEEDFGLTVIESMASGRPVIAYKKGGALESVIDKVTGEFFAEQTWEALADKVVRFKPEDYHPHVVREHAEKFDTEKFKDNIKKYIDYAWQEHQQKS